HLRTLQSITVQDT
nr:immunoglobulin heavy chain junction region [Mus musculus]